MWKALEFGWESAVFWIVTLGVSLALLDQFLRLVSRQEGKSHRVARLAVLWAVFLAVFVGIAALVWFFAGGSPLGFLLIFAASAVIGASFGAFARLAHRRAN